MKNKRVRVHNMYVHAYLDTRYTYIHAVVIDIIAGINRHPLLSLTDAVK